MAVVIRAFEPGDQAAVRDLVLAGLAERWGPAFDPARNTDLDDMAASYLSRGGEIVVAVEGGSIVATGTLVPDGPRQGRIVRVSVDANRRGEGLGRRVVAELVRRAGELHMHHVVASTDTPWLSAVALYRSCGFAELGRDDVETHFGLTVAP